MMQFLTYLGNGLSLFSVVNALLTSQAMPKRCNALIENSPWHVKNVVVYNAQPGAPIGSSIRFQVCDTNSGLEFDTSCGLTLPTGTGSRLEDSHGWHECDYGQLRFQYQPGNIKLERSYVDDCLGDPPYNGGIFFGNADTKFQVTETQDAVVWTQSALEVPITSQT